MSKRYGEKKYSISNVTLDDVESMVMMQARSWLETYPNSNAGVPYEWVRGRVDGWSQPEKLSMRRDRITQSKNDPKVIWRIAKAEDEQVVGLILAQHTGDRQHLGALYIDKEYYGSGLAQRLMEDVFIWADLTVPFDLNVATYNERAKAFYRKYGFEEVEGSEHYEQEKIPAVTMERKGDKV